MSWGFVKLAEQAQQKLCWGHKFTTTARQWWTGDSAAIYSTGEPAHLLAQAASLQSYFPITGARPRGTHGQLAVSCTVSHGLVAGGLLGWRSRVLDGQSIVMGRRGDNW